MHLASLGKLLLASSTAQASKTNDSCQIDPFVKRECQDLRTTPSHHYLNTSHRLPSAGTPVSPFLNRGEVASLTDDPSAARLCSGGRGRARKHRDRGDSAGGKDTAFFPPSSPTCPDCGWRRTGGCYRWSVLVRTGKQACRRFLTVHLLVRRGHKSHTVLQIWLTNAIPSRSTSRWQRGACPVMSQTCNLSDPNTNRPH